MAFAPLSLGTKRTARRTRSSCCADSSRCDLSAESFREAARQNAVVAPCFPLIAVIDIAFDFRSDTPPGKDPDARSPTLRRYHQILWSRPLPGGAPFELDVTTPHVYLHHLSELGEFCLPSDAVIPTFSREPRLARIIDEIPEVKCEAFNRIGYTIGEMMVFPGNRIGRKMTINMARGCHPRVKDRFDLTLECIRQHYLDEPSPLRDTLARYADFFGLFGDFAGYVDFFHLRDLVARFPRSSSSCRSRTSARPRCREALMRTLGTANARSSSLSRGTGASWLTSGGADQRARAPRDPRRCRRHP